jgi:DNA-binding protein YbaB
VVNASSNCFRRKQFTLEELDVEPNLGLGEDFQYLLDKQVREMREKAAALTEGMAESAATVRSRDGSVTVTVEPNGGLRNLELGHRACELGPARLTAAIMETVRTAQQQAARSTAEMFAAINGEGEAAELVRAFLPVEPDPAAAGDQWLAEEPAPEPTPPPSALPPSAPTQPPPRRRHPASGEDEDDESRPW